MVQCIIIAYPIASGERRPVRRSATFRLHGGGGLIVAGRRRYLQRGLDDGRPGRFRRYGGRDGDGRAHDGRQRDDGRHRRRLHRWATTGRLFRRASICPATIGTILSGLGVFGGESVATVDATKTG